MADEHAPPRDRPAAILCCGARGALDDAAGALLAGVLREQGYDAALAATGAGALAFEALPQRGDAACLRVADGRRRHRPGPPRGPARPGGGSGPRCRSWWGCGTPTPQKSEPEALARSLGVQRVALTLAEAAAAARELLGPPPEPAPSAAPEAAVPAAAI